MTLIMREREDRARGRTSDAGQGHQLIQGLGQATAVARDDFLRAAQEVPRPRVVAET